jgi:hypothetical protein
VAFPRRQLTEGESVVLELRPHWVSFGWSVPALLAAVAALAVVVLKFRRAPVEVGEALAAVVVVAGLWLAARAVRWSATELVVTTARVVQRSGVLARRGVEVRLSRINEISYRQSIGQRILGTGVLYLEVGGERGVLVFDHVRRPAAVAGVIHEQLDALGQPGRGHDEGPGGAGRFGDGWSRWSTAHDTPPAGVPVVASRSAAEQLVVLDDLRRRGVLSDAEFAERRARLVDLL